MYTLLHGFYKYLAQKDEYCVLILGLDDAGKTVSGPRSVSAIQENNDQLWFLRLLKSTQDVFGSGQNAAHQELQRHEPKAHYHNCWPKYRPNRYFGHSTELLGLGRTAGTPIVVGQILPRVTRNHFCSRFTWSRTNGRVKGCVRCVPHFAIPTMSHLLFEIAFSSNFSINHFPLPQIKWFVVSTWPAFRCFC